MRSTFSASCSVVGVAASLFVQLATNCTATIEKPNIIYILTDDLGYGDIHCLNPDRGKILTPNIDKFASQGMTFTDAHSTSSVCTPTRYSIVTGRYNWRSRLQRGVLGAYDKPLIDADRLTIAGFLKKHGYRTLGVGKWHLGFNIETADRKVLTDKPVTDGPITRGFDSFWCMDLRVWPPYMYIDDDHFTGTSLQPNTRMGSEVGGKGAPGINDYAGCLPDTVDQTISKITELAKEEKPFFLLCSLHAPHTPLSVTPEWKGKSGLGLYGDYVMETDAEVGRVLDAIDQVGLTKNTIVIFTSDNGCAPYINVHALESKGHYPSAQFRGYKSDVWDGGHRIPYMVRWPGVIVPGAICSQLSCQVDLLATCADILGVELPKDGGVDSISELPLWRGKPRPARQSVVHHSFKGNFAIRDKQWKLVLCSDSGGWSRGPKSPPVQLYNMATDERESRNLEGEHPEIVSRLTEQLKEIVANGRSTPGPEQKNDVKVNIFE